ncbi:sigma-70 family RNA polymerase sigma factor [uncultured Prevotella sp.]|uniref:sigma-70 family RNA polymerase sigma factor n=1 Tax=uncultured Prevotella sp. TaxID=159272 RepID=UPI0026249B01|nr:sigma-70 family RNA polymerase sigma factor [uncultured Prevotella sp.]
MAGNEYMETEELVRKCKNGDRDALAFLYQTYSGKLFRICADIVKDRAAAQDLLHDGFIIIFSSIGSLRSSGRLEAWMSRVIVNLAIKYINDRKHVPMAGTATDVPDEEEDGQGCCDVPLDELMHMIDMLPEGYRNVFRLSVLDGLSHDEIAHMLGIKPRTSSSQLLRARISLQKMIAAYRARLFLLLTAVAVSVVTLLLRQPLKRDGRGDAAVVRSAHTLTDVHAGDSVTDIHTALSISMYAMQKSHSKDTIATERYNDCPTDTFSVDALAGSIDALCRIAGHGSAVAIDTPVIKPDKYSADTPFICTTTDSHNGWQPGLISMTERASEIIMPRIIEIIEHSAVSGTRVEIETWEQLVHYLTYDVDTNLDPLERDALLRIALMNSGKIVTHKSFESPLQLGLNFNHRLSDKWSLDMGLRVTRHTTNMLTGSSDTTNISERQRIFYIGMPINATYTFMRSGNMSTYVTAGMTLDIPFSAKSDKLYNIDGKTEFSRTVRLGFTGLQWSVGAGLGVAYEIAPHLELFICPRITWYIPNGSKAETQWTDKPLQISIPFGIRISY